MPEALTVMAQIAVPVERIVNCIIGAIEGGYSPWLHSFVHDDKPRTIECYREARANGEGIWYSQDKFWCNGGSAYVSFDKEDDDEGAGTGRMTISLEELRQGLCKMADPTNEHIHHFGDLLAENDDASTHDVFMQMVVFGKVIYG